MPESPTGFRAGDPGPTPVPTVKEKLVNTITGKDPLYTPPKKTVPTLEAIDTSKEFRGKARFDFLMSHSNVLPGSPEFDNWILNFKGDPTDPEFNTLLSAAKSEAARRIEARTRKDERASIYPVQPSTADTEIDRELRGTTDPTAASMRGRRSEHMGNPEVRVVTDQEGNPVIGPDGKVQTEVISSSTKTTPLIKGLPIDSDKVLSGDPAVDGFIKAFYLDHGLELPDVNEEVAARTGDFVYVGETEYAATESEAAYSRPTYVYHGDAQAMVMNLPSDQVKQYQAQMGNPETGVPDSDLIDAWDEAVMRARRYAMAGQRVPIQMVFEQVLAEAAAKKAARGGGGAGATPLADYDYYFAMMQVLGDISGVRT